MKEGLIKDNYEHIIKEMQTIITISYILMVGIGMLFEFQKFSEFGINIFDYAEVFDFLIAPFSDFEIVLFSTISIIITFSVLKMDTYWRRKHPNSYSKMNFGFDKKSWFNFARYVGFALFFVSYLYISADIYGKHSAAQIRDQRSIDLKYFDNEVIRGIIIGKTKDIIFLLQNEKVIAIPISSFVKAFEIK